MPAKKKPIESLTRTELLKKMTLRTFSLCVAIIVGCTSSTAWRYDRSAEVCTVHDTQLRTAIWESHGWTLEPLPDDYGEIGRMEFPYSQSFVERHLRDMSVGDRFVVCDVPELSNSGGRNGKPREDVVKLPTNARQEKADRIAHAHGTPEGDDAAHTRGAVVVG
jgi:hypothetical protein